MAVVGTVCALVVVSVGYIVVVVVGIVGVGEVVW